jgi:hypothetical protein
MKVSALEETSIELFYYKIYVLNRKYLISQFYFYRHGTAL